MDQSQAWNELAAQLAVDSIRSSTAAGSGHPTSSLSAAHLLAVLYASHLRYDLLDPKAPHNDRFVLSKGHASPLMFSVLKAIGAITDDQLLSFRRFGSPVEGHPVPREDMPWVDVATGSLGQGLPIGLGMALAMRLDGLSSRVWVLMGDSESAEGSVWEAMQNAAFHGASNLTAIVDMNRLGQRGPTMLQWDADAYVARAHAFGWDAFDVDGHDVEAIDRAYRRAEEAERPTLIVAKTEKGHGVSFLADVAGWHGKALKQDQAKEAIEELGGERSIVVTPRPPARVAVGEVTRGQLDLPTYGEEGAATRKAFGQALAALAVARDDVVAIDGEVSNSTYTEDLEKVAPDRFFEMYIAEQAMVGVAVGMQVLGKVAFAATFGAFLTRAYDFVRMAAVSRANLRLCGSHSGVSIGEDGPSQMALEDLAMMRAVHGSTVLYPADGTATAKLVAAMADLAGISYVRTTRESTATLYGPNEDFPIGGSKVLAASADDRVTLVGAGITVHECLAAADLLASDGIAARVVDAYSVKPVDAATLATALDETGLVVTVEDHWIEGGLGDAVLAAIALHGPLAGRVHKIGVAEMPMSGSPEELRDWAGISATRIAEAVRILLA
ncbi:MAG TPA: transketolase [Actinomycetota bacterium]|nr:transketolase [Actinomycetota bacterium]